MDASLPRARPPREGSVVGRTAAPPYPDPRHALSHGHPQPKHGEPFTLEIDGGSERIEAGVRRVTAVVPQVFESTVAIPTVLSGATYTVTLPEQPPARYWLLGAYIETAGQPVTSDDQVTSVLKVEVGPDSNTDLFAAGSNLLDVDPGISSLAIGAFGADPGPHIDNGTLKLRLNALLGDAAADLSIVTGLETVKLALLYLPF